MKDRRFAELVESIQQAGDIKRGKRPAARLTVLDIASNVSDIRESLHLSRSQFAFLLCVSERTLEGWEQGRRQPSGPAKMLLQVATRHPEALLDTAKTLQKQQNT